MRIPSVALLGATALFGLSGFAPAHSVEKATSNKTFEVPAAKASGSCKSSQGLPDPTCTPGSFRTQDVNEICHGGSTKQFRPPTSYTNKLKIQQIEEYGYSDTSPADYEEDHLVSLELGGDGSDPKNLWPESHTGKYNSYLKDQVENWLHKQICAANPTMTPKEAQDGIASDWRQFIPDVLDTKSKKSTEIQ